MNTLTPDKQTTVEVIEKIENIIAYEVFSKNGQVYLSGTGEKRLNEILTQHDQAIRAESLRYKKALKEISKGMRRYNSDPYEHATNTGQDMKVLAEQALSQHTKNKE